MENNLLFLDFPLQQNHLELDLSAGEGGFGKVVPEVGNPEEHELTRNLAIKVKSTVDEYIKSMEAVKLKGGLKAAMQVSSLGNQYLQACCFDYNIVSVLQDEF